MPRKQSNPYTSDVIKKYQQESLPRYRLIVSYHKTNHNLSLTHRGSIAFSFESLFSRNSFPRFSPPYHTTWLQVVPLLATRVSSPPYLIACVSTPILIPPHAYQYHNVSQIAPQVPNITTCQRSQQ